MKNVTPELIARAKAAKSAEELLEFSKANGVEMTEEEANTYFAQLNTNGAISDDELDLVAGGGGCPDDGEEDTAEEQDDTDSYLCPECKSTSLAIAFGKRRCTKCGHVFANHF